MEHQCFSNQLQTVLFLIFQLSFQCCVACPGQKALTENFDNPQVHRIATARLPQFENPVRRIFSGLNTFVGGVTDYNSRSLKTLRRNTF